jgi:hypothetical protein
VKVNHDIDRFNAEVNAIQSKIKVVVRAALQDSQFPEVAIMRLNNYRELTHELTGETNRSGAAPVDNKGSGRGEPPKPAAPVEPENNDPSNLDNFALEDIPARMILVDQKVSEETHMVVYHHGK